MIRFQTRGPSRRRLGTGYTDSPVAVRFVRLVVATVAFQERDDLHPPYLLAFLSEHEGRMTEGESKDPDSLSFTMLCQGVLSKMFRENALMLHLRAKHPRDPSTRPRSLRRSDSLRKPRLEKEERLRYCFRSIPRSQPLPMTAHQTRTSSLVQHISVFRQRRNIPVQGKRKRAIMATLYGGRNYR